MGPPNCAAKHFQFSFEDNDKDKLDFPPVDHVDDDDDEDDYAYPMTPLK